MSSSQPPMVSKSTSITASPGGSSWPHHLPLETRASWWGQKSPLKRWKIQIHRIALIGSARHQA